MRGSPGAVQTWHCCHLLSVSACVGSGLTPLCPYLCLVCVARATLGPIWWRTEGSKIGNLTHSGSSRLSTGKGTTASNLNQRMQRLLVLQRLVRSDQIQIRFRSEAQIQTQIRSDLDRLSNKDCAKRKDLWTTVFVPIFVHSYDVFVPQLRR